VTLVDDETLARALASDLEAGFEALVCAYQQRLYAFALRLTGSPRDAEEIAQDAFVRAYRALAGYERERIQTLKLRAWLFQITVNVARNRARGRRLSEVPLSTPDDRDGAAINVADDDDADQPEVVAERHDDEARLAAIVASLPERYRAAVVLRHVQGLSYQEIATALRQPAGTVKSNVHRGVALLRDALGQAEAAEGQPELTLGRVL
jgi:RNA polymerase sigma-70 factor (ECF subfamily)